MPYHPPRITRIPLVALLACLPLSACAVRDADVARDGTWVPLGVGVEAHMYLDSSRVEVADGKHTVWLWAAYDVPDTLPGDTMPVWGTRTRHRLDCAAQVAEDLEVTLLLNREGTRLEAVPLEGTQRKPFAAHMLGDRFFPLACQWLTRNRPARG